VNERFPIFDHALPYDPSTDGATSESFEAFLKRAPAKWVVYLLTDERDQPMQLLCVKNLRYSLKRRLGGGEQIIGPTRRVDYRSIVRNVYWRRVDSAFEADLVYLEAARDLFPQTYRGMLGFRPAWFIHVNPHTTFPRYIKTFNLTGQTGTYFGPLEDKHTAQRLVHLIESVFDLCRDYSILIQSPSGGPCPWKQMDKCVGPCDGTISLHEYGQIVNFSAEVLADPAPHLACETQRMKDAAAELRFETAAKIKQNIDQLSQLGKGPFRHVRPLRDFRFLSLQRGPLAGTAKLFLITPGQIREIAGLIDMPANPSDLLRWILHLAESAVSQLDEIGAERIGVVAHQLFIAKHRHGVFLPLADLQDRTLAKAYRDLQNQKPPETPEESEGVTKELQAM